jgi:hypothetical protein
LLAVLRADGERVLCDALDLLATDTGENRFRHASSIVRGSRVGRTRIDDSAELAEINTLEKQGHKLTGLVNRGTQARKHYDVRRLLDATLPRPAEEDFRMKWIYPVLIDDSDNE